MNRFNKIFYTKKKVYEPQGKSEKKKITQYSAERDKRQGIYEPRYVAKKRE